MLNCHLTIKVASYLGRSTFPEKKRTATRSSLYLLLYINKINTFFIAIVIYYHRIDDLQ